MAPCRFESFIPFLRHLSVKLTQTLFLKRAYSGIIQRSQTFLSQTFFWIILSHSQFYKFQSVIFFAEDFLEAQKLVTSGTIQDMVQGELIKICSYEIKFMRTLHLVRPILISDLSGKRILSEHFKSGTP